MERCLKIVGSSWLLGTILCLSGCDYFKPPEAEPLDPKVTAAKKPAHATDTFDPAEGITHWKDTALNAPNDPKKPDKFQVVQVDSGELIRVRSVKTVNIAPKGKPAQNVKQYGVPEAMHVAGIVTPPPGQLGWAETVKKVQEWTINQEVDIEQDPVFPTDLQHRPMVQVFFKGTTGKLKGQDLSLNRMLIHTGYAVADINSPTSLDVKPWFNDEQFARTYLDPKTNKLAPLGLWGKGIVLAQRLSSPIPKNTKVVVHNVKLVQTGVPGASKTTRTSHISITTAPQTMDGSSGTAVKGGAKGTAKSATKSGTAAKASAPTAGKTKTTTTTTTTKTGSTGP